MDVKLISKVCLVFCIFTTVFKTCVGKWFFFFTFLFYTIRCYCYIVLCFTETKIKKYWLITIRKKKIKKKQLFCWREYQRKINFVLTIALLVIDVKRYYYCLNKSFKKWEHGTNRSNLCNSLAQKINTPTSPPQKKTPKKTPQKTNKNNKKRKEKKRKTKQNILHASKIN